MSDVFELLLTMCVGIDGNILGQMVHDELYIYVHRSIFLNSLKNMEEDHDHVSTSA